MESGAGEEGEGRESGSEVEDVDRVIECSSTESVVKSGVSLTYVEKTEAEAAIRNV